MNAAISNLKRFFASSNRKSDPAVVSPHIFDDMIEGCQIIDLEYRYVYVNEAVAKQGHRTKKELLGHTMMEMYPGIEKTEMFACLRHCMETRVFHNMENEFTYPDGSKGYFDLRMEPVPQGILIFSEDITQRKQIREILGLSELRYRRLFETAQDGILILDAVSGEIVDINPFLKKMLGYAKEELLGKKLWEIGVFKDIADSKIAFYKLQTKGYIRYEDLPLLTKDGRVIDVEFVSNIYMVGAGKVIQCNIRDITDRKIVEEKLSLQATMLEAAANGVVITDREGIIQWVNRAFTLLTGYTFEEAVGKSIQILNSGKQDKALYQHLWDTILDGNVWRGEVVERKKDGSLYVEEQTITPVKDANGQIVRFIAIKQDVTDRKKLEEELLLRNRELEQLSNSGEKTKKALLNVMEDLEETKATIEIEKIKDEAMLASIGDGLIATDSEGKILLVNKAFEDILGWKESEVQGKLLFEAITMVDENRNPIPESERLIIKVLKNHMQTTTTTTTTTFYKRKDGTFFPVSITISPIIRNKEFVGAIEVFHDITREKEIDRAKSEFVSLASHQLRTPLGIAKWYLEVLKQEESIKQAPQKIQGYFEEVYKSNERVLSLVRVLLSVSRIDQGRVKNAPEMVDIKQLIENIINEMQILAIKKKIGLSLAIKQQKIPAIYIDILRFHEVIENLIANALQYTKLQGRVTVSMETKDTMLLIRITDTGIGIAPEDKKKLFTKFFRADEASVYNTEGSGLGLYVVKSYVEQWGGKIVVQSELGKGSTFSVSLPMPKENKETSKTESVHEERG